MHLRNAKFICSTVALSFVLLFTHADAATLQLIPLGSAYKAGDTIRVKVAVTSDTDSINGVSSTITFPTDLLNLSSVSKTDSIMTLWAQEPRFSNSTGTASFEAVALSGFTGKNGNIVTLVFKAKKPGSASLSISNGSVLANNGEGTNVLTAKSGATLSIGEAAPVVVDKPKTVVETPVVPVEATINIQEIQGEDTRSPQATFMVTTNDSSASHIYEIQIDALPVITWTDDGTHIFQTPVLARGTHLIRFKTTTDTQTTISAYAEFTTDNLAEPVITEYPNNVFAGEYLVLKGFADPNTTVVFTTTRLPSAKLPFLAKFRNTNSKPVESTVTTNAKGEFNYISPEKTTAGLYSIYARSQSVGGLQSAPTSPIRVSVHDDIFSRFTLWLTSTLSLIIPLAALLFAFFFMIIYTLTRYRRFKKKIVEDLLVSESNARKGFQAIDADLEEYARLLLKSRTASHLTDAERETLVRIKQDISTTQQSISNDIRRTQDRLM